MTGVWLGDGVVRGGFDGVRRVRNYLGPVANLPVDTEGYDVSEPQAFLVEAAVDGQIAVHFHPVDQFQLVVGGSGAVGHHGVSSGTVHYADRVVPYGPIVPAEDGLVFWTLRARTDTGAHYMPDAQAGLRRRAASAPRRNVTVHVPSIVAGQEESWTFPVDDDDGLRVAARPLRPEAAASVPATGGSGGYLAVLEGSVALRGATAGAGAVSWLPRGTGALGVTAGDGGALVVLLQLPG